MLSIIVFMKEKDNLWKILFSYSCRWSMLEGWYCRSITNNNADAEEEDDEDSPEEEVPNYKDQYRNLKRKLKFLIYVRKKYFCV